MLLLGCKLSCSVFVSLSAATIAYKVNYASFSLLLLQRRIVYATYATSLINNNFVIEIVYNRNTRSFNLCK